VPDEIRTTGLTSASKQHMNPLCDTVQTGVVAHTDCPSDPYPTIASVATVVQRQVFLLPSCLLSNASPCWCTKFTAVCICILGSPSCHGHSAAGRWHSLGHDLFLTAHTSKRQDTVINLLITAINLHCGVYMKAQSVPRSKHTPSQL
jgi:hypothetical protein